MSGEAAVRDPTWDAGQAYWKEWALLSLLIFVAAAATAVVMYVVWG